MIVEQHRYDLVLRAATPIAHHAETHGNLAVLMTQKVRTPGGRVVRVPFITGDTLRHGLRAAASHLLLGLVGLDDRGLSEGALRLLFSGGTMTSAGSTARLDEYRELCELLPHLGLLGGALRNRVIPGRLSVDEGVTICAENAHRLPETVREWLLVEEEAVGSFRELVDQQQRVRMDPLLDPAKRKLLADGGAATQQRLIASEEASEKGDHKGKDDVKSSMMPRTHQVLCAGTLFWWRISAITSSELEHDTLLCMIGAFLADAKVGGKKGTGHGQVEALAAWGMPRIPQRAAPSQSVDLVAPDQRAGVRFRQHVETHAERIRDFLRTVEA